jgi:branched-chain amino acid transport system ATP-binding protein
LELDATRRPTTTSTGFGASMHVATSSAQAPLLELRGVCAGYGASRVLHDLDLHIHAGETLVMIGRNGVGKTTAVETIMGLTQHHAGTILLDGVAVERTAPHRRNRAGIAWVPQQREIFHSLTVEENLRVIARPGAWGLARVYELFPRLRERRRNYGDQLSGGEQQMLALGRALMTNPRLLLLDEPVEGLAPIIVQEMLAAIERMRADGRMAILLVEQKFELALAQSDRCVVIDHGSVVHEGPSAALLADPALIERLLGLAH